MDFSDALRAMKDGQRVRRAFWRESASPVYDAGVAAIMLLTAPSGVTVEQIVVIKPDGKVRVFASSQWDLLSDDWEIAE